MFTAKSNYIARDRLKNGTAVIVRAIKASDKARLQQLMNAVNAESRYFRFFCAKKRLTDVELKYFSEIDFDSHIALIVSLGDEIGSPIAVGRYITLSAADGSTSAEMALLVGENYQRQGLGRILLHHLAQIARQKGVSEFVCYIMPENSKMLNFLRHCQYKVKQRLAINSVCRLSLDLHAPGSA